MEIKKNNFTFAFKNLKSNTKPTPKSMDTTTVSRTSIENSCSELPISLLWSILTMRLNTIIPMISEIQLSYINSSLSYSNNVATLGITMALLITESGVAYSIEDVTLIFNKK